MEIISHRGYWFSEREKNTATAFERSFSLGFGTETDIRDYKGELVISHDIASSDCITFKEFISIYKKNIGNNNGTLALNVKADGLQEKVRLILEQENLSNYFFFDMSIPDMLGYFSLGLSTFARYSEYESINSLYDRAEGIWLDGFSQDLVTADLLNKFLSSGKKVCIVSPELHHRNHIESWKKYKTFPHNLISDRNLILCTDLPEDATEFFL
ncbi:hypothetical protein [Photorhabdus sp. CRCIA-P01]|uniref:hypothetical protein n=1 Tax=Photorhabdus sp. CRCIA-P01 TaxID=2019570 RepID=UPI000E59B08D|nr:hypothetical protein [Photorhabdus sp. CRCIA-P01]